MTRAGTSAPPFSPSGSEGEHAGSEEYDAGRFRDHRDGIELCQHGLGVAGAKHEAGIRELRQIGRRQRQAIGWNRAQFEESVQIAVGRADAARLPGPEGVRRETTWHGSTPRTCRESHFRVTADLLDLRNLVTTADLIVRSAMERKESFLSAGGKEFHYIPCLNERADWVKAMHDLAITHLAGWPNTLRGDDLQKIAANAAFARAMGALR